MVVPPGEFEQRLAAYADGLHNVVPLHPDDKLLAMDFTSANTALTDALLQDTDAFSAYVTQQLQETGARYGVGGYDEDRVIYRRSDIFRPSPQPVMIGDDGAKAPSRWEGEEDPETFLVEEETVGYRYADPMVYPMLKEYAIKHRSKPTDAELVLWNALKTKSFHDFKFRRQHIIDRFITDFVCLKCKLVIEVDGLIHQLPDHLVSDQERTERLQELGFNVIRFTNDQVLHNLDQVLGQIFQHLSDYKQKHLASATQSNQSSTEAALDQINASLSGELRAAGGPSHREGSGMGRSIHLGLDIWGPAHTPISAPLPGIVHSFAFNDAFGDYGATLILQHHLDDYVFYTLYGHLSLASIENKKEGQPISAGEIIAWFGEPKENGHWPPHLHFQIILDMQGKKGDYPGVCTQEDRAYYLSNCPNPALLFPQLASTSLIYPQF